MCLAIPSKEIHVGDGYGVVEVEGVRRKVSIQLLKDVHVGDYIIVHAGYGLHRIDEKIAAETLSPAVSHRRRGGNRPGAAIFCNRTER